MNLYAYCLNNPVMYTDPNGTFVFTTLMIGGLIAGAAIGFGTVAYIDYKDDGKVFNGSVGWETYVGGTLIGGAIGIGIGYIAPLTFSATIPTGFGWAMTSAGTTSLFVTSTATLSITGAQIIGATSLLSASIMYIRTKNKSNGYWGERYSDDHNPPHIHFKGTDGTNIRIGPDGRHLPGEPSLLPQHRKALKNLWDEILKRLFGIG